MLPSGWKSVFPFWLGMVKSQMAKIWTKIEQYKPVESGCTSALSVRSSGFFLMECLQPGCNSGRSFLFALPVSRTGGHWFSLARFKLSISDTLLLFNYLFLHVDILCQTLVYCLSMCCFWNRSSWSSVRFVCVLNFERKNSGLFSPINVDWFDSRRRSTLKTRLALVDMDWSHLEGKLVLKISFDWYAAHWTRQRSVKRSFVSRTWRHVRPHWSSLVLLTCRIHHPDWLLNVSSPSQIQKPNCPKVTQVNSPPGVVVKNRSYTISNHQPSGYETVLLPIRAPYTK